MDLTNAVSPALIRTFAAAPSSSSVQIKSGQVAQLVEQGIENPRVGGSIPSLATIFSTTWPAIVRALLYLGPRQSGSTGCAKQARAPHWRIFDTLVGKI